MESSGGGGFGDPLERDPAHVVADSREGYVTRAAAEAVYGVIFEERPDSLGARRTLGPGSARGRSPFAKEIAGHVGAPHVVDVEATRREHAALAAARVHVRLASADDLDGDGRPIRLDAATARRLGVAAGAIVELVNPRGAPLRCWVVAVDAARPEIAAAALRMLGLAAGSEAPELEIRGVHSGTLGAAQR